MQDPMFSLQHHPQNKNKIALISMQREHLPPPQKKKSVKETFSKFFYTSSSGVFSLRNWMLIRQRSTLRNLVTHGGDTLN